MLRTFFSVVLAASIAAPVSADESELLFVRRIAPLLRDKCLGCHGADSRNIQGSLNLTSQKAAMAGGDSGVAALIARDPDHSPLVLAASRESDEWSAMPPKAADRLTETQIDWLKQWIRTGAAWPDEQRQKQLLAEHAHEWSAEDGIPVKTSGGLSDDWTHRRYQQDGLWAYQPVRRPMLNGQPYRSVDEFLPPTATTASRADRRTLIRRATFDLIGLPPTPDEVDDFLNDPREDRSAFSELVDRLLASDHYGERMAQHWLDVVRYADSSGFANDYERGNAWRYRDYIVRSFNQDKPYDQFVREQLAGDELDPDDPEMLVAVGFLRMGPWELTGMEVARIARQRFLDDVTNSVGETFLAHSLQCARCHDHKFDPIPTREYYSVQAVFAATQLTERPAEFLPTENVAGFDEQKYLLLRKQEYQKTLEVLGEVLLQNAEQWFQDHGLPADAWHRAVEKAQERLPAPGKRGARENVFNEARRILANQNVPEDQYPPKLVGFTPEQFGMERVARKGLERLQWEFDRYRPVALSVYNGPTPDRTSVNSPQRLPERLSNHAAADETCILNGGDPFSRGDGVSPGALSVIADVPFSWSFETSSGDSGFRGRRSAFARWVANPANPLTTRTMANRIWQWHFGRGIAENPNNFGSTGKRPRHPELLDWLAITLVDDHWSLKSLHRRIMNSDLYCRSSHANPANRLSPQSGSLLREDSPQAPDMFSPRRLSAEELRDAMLAVSGELNPNLGGIPCRPEINQEAALQPRQVMGTFAAAWVPNPLPADRHRRSLYVLKLRGLMDPMLEVFNSPAPDFSCERRESSTVTPQVFALLNSRNTQQRSLAMACRVLKNTTTDDEAVTECFRLAYSRPPTDQERQLCRQLWRSAEADLPQQQNAAQSPPLQVVREAVEENTGERFTFPEHLYANADFVPDIAPNAVSRHARALANICLALLNSNEFVYVY
ncbi:MAG: PSD1 and planctomycete cytochrome C domain-containing protein [Planctomycetaceae bacterium]